MAISEVCQFEVKDHVDHLVKAEGLSRNEASKRVAGWFTEILGIKIKPETIRQKDYRARLATDVTTNDRPKCERCEAAFVMNSPKTGEPMKHGLCRSCRRIELAEERNREKVEAVKKIPIDPEAECYWNEMTESIFFFLMQCENAICGKVGEEILNKIYIVREGLVRLLDKIEAVVEKTSPGRGNVKKSKTWF